MPKEKTRFVFIDILRGWALLVMVEVHVFNVFLLPSLKSTEWFKALDFLNGLVAPSFLFISGFAFAISTRGKSEELRKFDYPFWKKLGRILLIILAGYSLHLPILSLRRLMHYYSRDVVISFYNVDILQCIGIGLLFLLLLRLLIKSDKIYNIVIIISALAVVLLSPKVWQTDFTNFTGIPLANYFNTMNGSFFPLFPWIGFILAGAVSCKYYLDWREKNKEKDFIIAILIIGLFIALAGHVILAILNVNGTYFKPHPVFFFQRLGYVLFLLGLCWYYAEKRRTRTSFVLDVGRESLLIYWLHLQIIYRRFYHEISLSSIFGDKLDVWGCIAATLILGILMILVANAWRNFKRNYRSLASNITIGVVSLCIIIFLIGF